MSATSVVRGILVTGALASLLLFGSAISPAGAQLEEEQASPRGKKRMSIADFDMEAITENLWWNESDYVRQLGLSEQQRSAMDTVIEDFVDGNEGRSEAVRSAREKFFEVLESGDLAAARKQLDDLQRAEGTVSRAVAEMKIEVLDVLDEAQRRLLATEHSDLLRTGWLRSSMREEMMERRQEMKKNRKPARRSPPPAVGEDEEDGGG